MATPARRSFNAFFAENRSNFGDNETAAILKLFELGKSSSVAAARLAGTMRTLVLARLASYGVDTFQLT
jgi:hypothetical protein